MRWLGLILGMVIGCLGWSLAYGQFDRGQFSCDQLPPTDSQGNPIIPPDEGPGGPGIFAGGDAICEGWNACPCELDCEHKVIASCAELEEQT